MYFLSLADTLLIIINSGLLFIFLYPLLDTIAAKTTNLLFPNISNVKYNNHNRPGITLHNFHTDALPA